MDVSWSLRQTVFWRTQTGEIDRNGQPVYADMGEIPARVNRKARLVKGADGVDVVSDTQAHVLKRVRVNDRIVISGREHRVLSVGVGLGLYDGAPSFYILYL